MVHADVREARFGRRILRDNTAFVAQIDRLFA